MLFLGLVFSCHHHAHFGINCDSLAWTQYSGKKKALVEPPMFKFHFDMFLAMGHGFEVVHVQINTI